MSFWLWLDAVKTGNLRALLDDDLTNDTWEAVEMLRQFKAD